MGSENINILEEKTIKGSIPQHEDLVHIPIFDHEGLDRWILPHQIWKLIGSGKDILDIGCGDGCWTVQMQHQGNRVWGVEISKKNLQSSREKELEIHRTDLNVDPLPFPDRTFDLVTSLSVMEHVFDYRNVFQEAHRVLKEGGEFLFLGPNFSNIFYRWQLFWGTWEWKESDVRYWTPRILKKRLEEYKFQVTLYPQKYKTLLRKIVGFFSNPR